MKKTTLNSILLLTSIMIFAGIVFLLFSFSGDSAAKARELTIKDPGKVLTIVSPGIPDGVRFAGEPAPLDIFYVRESLDRELLVNAYWHSSTILMLKRANRWFPVIEPILRDHNIPDDFKYLALIESGFSGVVSPKGATGFWQFLEKTAKEYHLEVNEYVDERYHVEKSTEAACRYLIDSYRIYNNWTLVAAAYNAGNRRISESLDHQKTDSYYELYLNEETSRYIYRILAIKILSEDQRSFGFQLEEEDLYPALPTSSLEVTTPVLDLVAFAKEHGMTYRLLKELNPWLRSRTLPNLTGKSYSIKVIQ